MAKINDYDALTDTNKEITISTAQLNSMLVGSENTNFEAVMEQSASLREAKIAKLIALGLTEEEARA
jgi:hypothetical protein